MQEFSFIDYDKKDFLRHKNGKPIIINADNWHKAEDWLLAYGDDYGWSNHGTKIFCWTTGKTY